jgi:hypothetical protein
MTSPNVNATPQSVSDKLDGIDGNGAELSYRKVAMFYEAHIFGLPVDYAFTEGPNETASVLNHAATLAKLFTRKHTMPDGNQYDALDCLWTLTKAAILANPHINDDEPLSVNYKKPATS